MTETDDGADLRRLFAAEDEPAEAPALTAALMTRIGRARRCGASAPGRRPPGTGGSNGDVPLPPPHSRPRRQVARADMRPRPADPSATE